MNFVPPSRPVAAGPAAARDVLRAVNHAILFLCTSMYLGTGWSLALFSFPVARRLAGARAARVPA